MTGSDNVCLVNQINDLRGSQDRINSPKLQAGHPRICRGCQQPFATADGRRRFCSEKCQRITFSASLRRRQTEHRERFPHRVAARQALKNAILLGKVRHCSRCEACGKKAFTEGHHDDYAKPLYVTWLCRACHAGLDGGEHFGCGREKHDTPTVTAFLPVCPNKSVGGSL